MRLFDRKKLVSLFEEKWSDFKLKFAQLEILEQFYSAETLQENNPMMVSILQAVPQEIKEDIDDCQVDK